MQFMLQTASFGIYSVNFDILMYTVAVVVYWKQSVVLISPNMKEPYVREEYQWIPWEIKYSISRQHRGETTSQRNAIVAVKLPDKNGRYDYYEDMKLFRILKGNIDSRYIPVFCWSSFVQRFDYCIDTAFMYKQRVEEKWIVKFV